MRYVFRLLAGTTVQKKMRKRRWCCSGTTERNRSQFEIWFTMISWKIAKSWRTTGTESPMAAFACDRHWSGDVTLLLWKMSLFCISLYSVARCVTGSVNWQLFKNCLLLFIFINFFRFSYSYVRPTKLASSLVNFWAHYKIVCLIDWFGLIYVQKCQTFASARRQIHAPVSNSPL